MEGIVDSSHTGLVAHAIAGNSAAFARLVEPYLPSALSSARLILGESGDAADAVQDGWIDPIDHLERALASHQLQRAFEALEAEIPAH